MSHLGRLVCRDCGAEITGTDDGTGQLTAHIPVAFEVQWSGRESNPRGCGFRGRPRTSPPRCWSGPPTALAGPWRSVGRRSADRARLCGRSYVKSWGTVCAIDVSAPWSQKHD